MDIICASICYRGYAQDEIAACLAEAPKIGYRHMEIHGPAVWSPQAVDAFDLPSMRRSLSRSGLRCAGIYTPGWGGRDDADVERHAKSIAACVEFARQLGADHVASTGAEPRQVKGSLERTIACAQRVLSLAPRSPGAPVKLALEPHLGNTLEQPADFAAVLQACDDPRLGVCVDTGHFHSAGVDTVRFIHEHTGRIHSVHLKDHLGAVSVGIGRGEIDLPAVIGALRGAKYDGGLTIELEVNDPQNLPRYTTEAYYYVSGMIGARL